jgi:hypothetical protein
VAVTSGRYYRGMTSSPETIASSETEHDRLERNWSELLQELRVIQTGTQILTGFLLTVAFQQRFASLDNYQVTLYLALVITGGMTTALGLAPVSLHRTLFRMRAKDTIVRITNRVLQIALIGVALTLSGTVWLIFDVVAGRGQGLAAGVAALVVISGTWLAMPITARRLMR